MKRSPEVRLHHTWVLDNVPAKWTTSQTLALLQATFENVELLHQNRRKGQTFAYVFKGAAERNSDIIALLVETDEAGQTTLWARWAEPRAKAPTQSRTEGGWSLRPPAQQWPTEAATIAVQSGDAAGAAEAMPVDNDEAKKKKKVSFAEPPPNSKKAKAEQRAIPAGLKLVPMEPDGNCLFSSAAHVIKLTLKKNVSALQLRAEVVEHMRKHEQRYAIAWDKELPDGKPSDSFADYLNAVAKNGTWGGHLELAAIGRAYDLKFTVFPTSLHLEPFAVHAHASRGGVLRFNGSHYDVLVADGKNSTTRMRRWS